MLPRIVHNLADKIDGNQNLVKVNDPAWVASDWDKHALAQTE